MTKLKSKNGILKLKGKTIVFIDYANIKAWAREKELAFDMQVLYQILKDSGVEKILFYYGTDPKNPGSFSFLRKMREIGFEVITKPVKYFKISLLNLLQRRINKANFDVEITLDMALFEKKFDIFILFSGDGDFLPVVKHLRGENKKVIVISGRKYLAGELIETANSFLTLERFSRKTKSLLIKSKSPQSGDLKKSKCRIAHRKRLVKSKK